MILFELVCNQCKNEFEAWFKSFETMQEHMEKGMVECPICGSCQVTGKLNSPALPSKANQSNIKTTKQLNDSSDIEINETIRWNLVKELHGYIKNNFEDVGDKFVEEIRDIDAGKKEKRNIYGNAKVQDVKDLIDDGIDVMPLPNLPKDN